MPKIDNYVTFVKEQVTVQAIAPNPMEHDPRGYGIDLAAHAAEVEH